MSVELWLALDVSDTSSAFKLAKKLKRQIDVFKIGLELFTAEGPSVVRKLKDIGGRIFLDLKLHDIPNTVAGAIRNLTRLGADYIDIHAAGGPEMLMAAKEAAEEEAERSNIPAPQLLAITILTSLDSYILRQLMIKEEPIKLVEHWAKLAKDCGMSGVVNSLEEVTTVRKVCGDRFLSVTPGIRIKKTSKDDDQRRIGTPRDAVILGSSAIVVGRPILQSDDPVAAASAIKEELNKYAY